MKIVYYGPASDDGDEGGPVIRFSLPVTAEDLARVIGDPSADGAA